MKKNKNLLIGITGGIAAYKATRVVSDFVKKGYNVDIIMTENATKIITPLAFETLSKRKVHVKMFERPDFKEVEHISLAQKADLVLIVPATYNIIGKVASGIADDMLSTVISATKAPVYFALAMNDNMYKNPILKTNIKKLEKFGYNFIEADTGNLACNSKGKGRLKNPLKIIEYIEAVLETDKILIGKKILITAGPTQEKLDPIRYFTNGSTGKMGYALAKIARNLGAKVTLVSGPVDITKPTGVKIINVKSAIEMYNEVKKLYSEIDIIIMAAAVSDYRPKYYSEKKIKKKQGDLILKLKRNPDILYELGKLKKDQTLVGFAAESEDLIKNALRKKEKKNMDYIIANDISNFGKDTNKIFIIKNQDEILEYQNMPKMKVAYEILKTIS
ncbi:MAG: bifunctional phosphopantothenoylcysteine decarboxylase/phosphopantothenate--cysteine ligase CoaBC [Fusobacteriota bacterium]